jgi:uncharacterized protein (TIGR02145 family)
LVTAKTVGNATIMVETRAANLPNYSATCTVTVTPDPTVTDQGVVISGVTWATRNVDDFGKFAQTPEDFGKIYQWNRNIAYSATDVLSPSNWNSSLPDHIWDNRNDPCPDGWRMPTTGELDNLIASGSIWDPVKEGRVFGSGANTIFLPNVGYRVNSDGGLNPRQDGWYWTSSVETDGTGGWYANMLHFTDSFSFNGAYYLNYGFSIRCVQGTK